MRASERLEEKRHQTDVTVKLDDVQCCHILTKVRTDAGGIFFDLLAELEIQDDASWRIILAAKKSLGDISLFVALYCAQPPPPLLSARWRARPPRTRYASRMPMTEI